MAQQAAVEKVEISENQKVRITIIPRFCKGCEICPKLCPTQVLGMEMFKVKVLDVDKCIICNACELRCPDFAISIEKK
ncbi:MAG TPA: 4Fe-4S binding protein [Candidatus Deferrimicrobiaceae bacterium]|jgi:2-oxoglutarate ferredoxin oxidoreductase subunit delta